MENWELVLEIVLPAIAIGLTAFLIIRSYLKYEESRNALVVEKTKLEIIFPARMQAYERIILLLERSTPENLIRRVLRTNCSAPVFQSELISAIRTEYDHNLSQQVYISPAAWQGVKAAVEETIRMINVSATRLTAAATATDLAHSILETSSLAGKFPTQAAIENIKKEFSFYFLNNSGK